MPPGEMIRLVNAIEGGDLFLRPELIVMISDQRTPKVVVDGAREPAAEVVERMEMVRRGY